MACGALWGTCGGTAAQAGADSGCSTSGVHRGSGCAAAGVVWGFVHVRLWVHSGQFPVGM